MLTTTFGRILGTLLAVATLLAAILLFPPNDRARNARGGGEAAELLKSNPDAPDRSVGRLPSRSIEIVKRPKPGGAGTPRTMAMGFTSPLNVQGADNWEPDIAADDSGHIYMVFTYYDRIDTPTVNEAGAYIQVSNDGGATFSSPQLVGTRPYPDGRSPTDIYDPIVTVDKANGHVYVAWMAIGGNVPVNASMIYIAKSTDFGQTFPQVVKASEWNGGSQTGMCKFCDHEWIAAHDGTVYAAYSDDQRLISVSTDGGLNWTEDELATQSDASVFAEDALVDPATGYLWTAWATCVAAACNGAIGGRATISRTDPGTTTTTITNVNNYQNGYPNCPFTNQCGYEYFAAQNDIAMDAAGNLYMVYMTNPANTDQGPPRVGLSRCEANCTVAGNWTSLGNIDDKAANGCAGSPPACYALFPRIDAGEDGEIVVMWVDDRRGNPMNHTNGWNTRWRVSLDGGDTWESRSHKLSRYKKQFPLVSERHGFRFPYGDYMDVAISPGSGAGLPGCTRTAAFTWGEGRTWNGSYDTPAASGLVYVTVRCLD